MVVDVAHVRHIRPEHFDHFPDSPPRLDGIDGMPRSSRLLPQAAILLEVDVGHKIAVVRGRFSARIRHGEQRYFVPLRFHQLHQFEQVHLGSTEPVVVFVAVKNPHDECFRAE